MHWGRVTGDILTVMLQLLPFAVLLAVGVALFCLFVEDAREKWSRIMGSLFWILVVGILCAILIAAFLLLVKLVKWARFF